MKKYFPLHPSIEHIEQRLFGVTDGLIEAVERGETSPGVADAVRQSAEWAEHQADRQESPAQLAPLVAEIQETALPRSLRDLIQRRVAARSLTLNAFPAPGQIVSLEKVVTPRLGQLDAILTEPMYVLLDSSAEMPVVWHGWVVSGETDYAGWWDFVLQEQDAPFDPEAAMIHLWNPVRLYLPMTARVVGQLSPSRLQAVRSLAADFATEEPPADIPAWIGRVASRNTSAGLRVSTGSPLGDGNDPRHRYQALYFEAAEVVREPARLALRALAELPVGQMGLLLNRLIATAGRWSEILLPEPRVAIAMSGADTSSAPDLSWPDLARMRIHELTAEGAGRMEISAIGTEPLLIEVRKGLNVEERVDLLPGGVDTITWDQGSTTLVLLAASGRKLELTLKGVE